LDGPEQAADAEQAGAAAAAQRRSAGRAASPDGARCDAEGGVLFGSDGAVVPAAVGPEEVVGGGMCAPDPVADPDPEAEAEGGGDDLPVLSRWRNSTSAAITARTGMMR
jgi:hypothetical protein